MKKLLTILTVLSMTISINNCDSENFEKEKFEPFKPVISYEEAGKRADSIVAKMSIEEKIEMAGGHNSFYIKGFEQYDIPQLYLSDATQGVHIRKDLSDAMEKSVAFPCPLALTATWNTELAHSYAKSVGEECRAGDIAVLLGPGMNIYRISQNGRNFEYFGEDPFLAARMIENYVTGVQSAGTIATLKHFVANNNEYHRRTTNAIVDERTLHEIYLPAFKAGIDAGAMAVMTAYNQVNNEWAGQSRYVIDSLLREQLGFKWLVMSDWWSTWDPEKTIKSGLNLEMPGDPIMARKVFQDRGNILVKANAKRLIDECRVTEEDIDRMVKGTIRTCIAMGLYDRPVKDEKYLMNFEQHEQVALETAREAIVLLKNENSILPVKDERKILLTGYFVEKLAHGGGSAYVEGYNVISMLEAFKNEFGDKLDYVKNPSDEQIQSADIVLLSIGTMDTEGADRPFELEEEMENRVLETVALNPNTVVIVNSGSGIKMTEWNDKAAAILYSWYLGQNGNIALAEIISGKINPSGKLPMTLEKKFEDSPGYGYLPEGYDLRSDWDIDMEMDFPITDIKYDEGVFVGYRWYEAKKIEPLYPFGYGLSYTVFEYADLEVSHDEIEKGESLEVEFKLTNVGNVAGYETAQLYVGDIEAAVVRPVKELKGFIKIFLNPGESKGVRISLEEKDFSFWDAETKAWKTEPGEFDILIGSSSANIKLSSRVTLR